MPALPGENISSNYGSGYWYYIMSITVYCQDDMEPEETCISPDNDSWGVPTPGRIFRGKSRGDSMYPLIQTGDTLLITPVTANELHPGDITFYRLPAGKFMVHRFIKRNGSGFLLAKGDSRRQFDDPITTEQVFGRISSIEHNDKSLTMEGIFSKFIGLLIAFIARYPLPFQIRLKQTLGRLQWFLGGKAKA
jgi:hypothetical protein